jgi:hypothetical protein
MKKLFIMFLGIIFFVFSGCDTGTNPDNEDQLDSEDDNSNDVGIIYRMITDAGETYISNTEVLNLGSVATIEYEGTRNRALGDTGNVIDFVDFDGFILLRDTEDTVFLVKDDNSITNLTTKLGVQTVYINSAQLHGTELFIGADRTLYKIADSGTGSFSSYAEGEVFSAHGDGGNDSDVWFLVNSDSSYAVGASIDSGSYSYRRINLADGSINVSDDYSFSTVLIIIIGNKYYSLQSNGYTYIDLNGDVLTSSATVSGDATIDDVFDGARLNLYLSDNEFCYTDYRFDVDKIKEYSSDDTVIPKTSTILEDWFVKIYRMHDFNRFYVRIDKDTYNATVFQITYADSGITVSQTDTTSDIVDSEGLVKDFWILEDGSVVFNDPGLEGNARYTTL